MEPHLNPKAQLEDLLGVAEHLFGQDAAEETGRMMQALQDRRASDQSTAKAIAATFKTANGKKTLNWLADVTVRQAEPRIDELLAERAEDRPYLAGYRAGLRDVFYLIADAINQAKVFNDAEQGES